MKSIFLLFSKYTNLTSKFIYFAGGRSYTHVSISLDDKFEYFYTFNKKGFRKEFPKKHIYRVESISYEIEVTDEEFEKIKNKIEEFEKKKDSLGYSALGVLFCFLRIRFKFKDKYFCSQFIAEILQNIEYFKLEKDASLYYPKKLHNLIHAQLPIKNVYYNPL